MTAENQPLDWAHEHERWEKEMRGLVRALGLRALQRLKRPRAAWNDMVEDMEIFSWRAWRSLRLRGLEPQEIGAWAISDRAVRSSLQGAVFRPIGTMGDRSWADSVHNRRNGVRVKSNREDWQLTGKVEGEQEDSDLMADWASWKATLTGEDRELVEALEAGDSEAPKTVKGIKRRKRALADRFKAYRGG